MSWPAIANDLPRLAAACYDPSTWNVRVTASDARAAVTNDPQTVVAIPGTDLRNLGDDWADALDLIEHVDPLIGSVGFGPLRRARALWNALSYRLPQVWSVTGHSLGGAVALVLAALAHAYGKPPAYVMTFAAPLCLGPDAARRVGQNIMGIDFARHGDPVAWVPELLWTSRPRPLTMLGEPVLLPSLANHSMAEYEALATAWMKVP